ncbi:hypothetical protein [Pantoea agglomerans]|uniref:hypothetical protein n=1 Tax=Enterobacter agglomerans TaxID=549 RepID=UPI001300BF50|nr:hypothetical protein [Pantoea agglomerans]
MLALESDDRALVTGTNPASAARTEAIEKELKTDNKWHENFFHNIMSCAYILTWMP